MKDKIQSILGRVFCLWALLCFAFSILVVVGPISITYFFPEPKGLSLFRKISIVWIRSYLFSVGCSLKLNGQQYFQKNEPYVVVCNHTSFLDILIITPFVPGPNRTIAKASLGKIPIFGLIYKRGSILIDRANKQSTAKGYLRMKATLQKGIHMILYPEGTRNKTDQPLQPFKDGAFNLAIDTQKKIIPAVIKNTKQALPANRAFYFWPQRLSVSFLPPVEIANHTTLSLKQAVHGLMESQLIGSGSS